MNLKEWEVINQKTLIIIGALCAVFIIATSGLLYYHDSVVSDKDQQINSLCNDLTSLDAEVHDLNTTVQTLTETITQKNNLIEQKNDEIISLNNETSSLNSQIEEIEAEASRSRATVVVEDLNVEDLNFSSYNTLRVSCRLNNTGEGTAFNTGLLVRAYNAEGRAIETIYQTVWLSPGSVQDVIFSINYEGSPIQSWEITPIWANTLVLPISGTFPP
jgi:vacuolar-type H+-ATPase subunit I/STV1